ncbi:hypothetical protein Bbelb_340760 [Branchiostoma belcheri]|nr:hypothetical protein Bbelb_340760 [Branchiostoma belcheri]
MSLQQEEVETETEVTFCSRVADDPAHDKLPTTDDPAHDKLPTTDDPAHDKLPTTDDPAHDKLPIKNDPANDQLPIRNDPAHDQLPNRNDPARDQLPTTKDPAHDQLTTTEDLTHDSQPTDTFLYHFTGCTTVYLNVRNGPRLLAHNEDGDSLIKDLGYVVVATLNGMSPPYGNVRDSESRESFTAFCYPGLLAGNAYGFNLHGLCTAGNFQLAKCVEKDKIPQRFACRALLSAASVEQAVDILRTGCGIGMASGYSYNLAVSTKDGDNTMYSVEVAPAEGEARNLVSVHTVEPGEVGSASSYNHYNIYEHLSVPEWPLSPSSHHRKARAVEMAAPRTKQDVLAVLGDTKDPEYPIFRSGTGKDKGYTLSTAVFDLQEGVLEVYIGNPTVVTEPALQFYLPG